MLMKKPMEEVYHMDLHVTGLEVLAQKWPEGGYYAGYVNRERPYSGFILICEGHEGTYTGPEGTIHLHAGDMLYVPKGSKYFAYFHAKGNYPISSYLVNFNLFDQDENEILLDDHIFVASHDDHNELLNRFVELSTAYHDVHRSPIKVKALFYSFLDSILSARLSENRDYYAIRRGIIRLRNEWNQNIPIEEYARACGVSSSYFHRVFRKWSSMTPVEYRNQLRISNARSILRSGEMSVSEIAAFIGFEDPQYFCRVFHRLTGCSPQQYRKG